MTRILSPLLFTTSLMASLPLLAESGIADDIQVARPQSSIEGVYLGGAMGQAEYDVFDDSDVGFSLFAGIHLNEFVAVELGGWDFGEVENEGVSAEASTIYVAILGQAELQSDLSVYGKLGFSNWDSDFKSDLESGSDSGNDVVFGAGMNYQFSAHASVQFSIDQYALDEEDIRVFGIGLKYAL